VRFVTNPRGRRAVAVGRGLRAGSLRRPPL